MQAPRRRGGTFVAMEPEKNKRASAAASVRLCHLFIHHAAPRHAGAKGLACREALAQQGQQGARQGGAWEYLIWDLAPRSCRWSVSGLWLPELYHAEILIRTLLPKGMLPALAAAAALNFWFHPFCPFSIRRRPHPFNSLSQISD